MNIDIVFTSGTGLWGPTLWEYLTHLRVVVEAEGNSGYHWMKVVDGGFIHS